MEQNDEVTTEEPKVPEVDMQAFKQHLSALDGKEKEPMLGIKELKALKAARYDKIVAKYDTIYVLKNKRTGVIVELRGASDIHCCKSIGWRPRHVRVLEVKDAPTENETPEEESNDTETTEEQLA